MKIERIPVQEYNFMIELDRKTFYGLRALLTGVSLGDYDIEFDEFVGDVPGLLELMEKEV